MANPCRYPINSRKPRHGNTYVFRNTWGQGIHIFRHFDLAFVISIIGLLDVFTLANSQAWGHAGLVT